jgi:SAM-dependent methyltransferase
VIPGLAAVTSPLLPAPDFDRFARFYDVEHDDYRDDVPMYAGFAGAQASVGDSRAAGVLELACGTGRCLVPLATAGHEVTGVDISPAMLAVARQRAERAGASDRVRLVKGDMRDCALGREFGLVFIALNSLMHLETREAQGQALTTAARHLARDGRLVLDLFNPEVGLPDPMQEGQLFLHCLKVLPGGEHLLHFQAPTVDRAAQLVSMANFYDEIRPDGSVARHLLPFRQRYLTRGELELLIAASGLHLDALYGSYELDPFASGSERMIAVASLPL